MHASSERLRSSADSVISTQSSVPSIATAALPALQHRVIDDGDRLSPLLEDDPKSWDLVAPEQNHHQQFSLETRSEQLFSREHLKAIFADTPSLLRFTSYLSVARPNSVPTLIYYLDAQKALRAINYANAVAEALEPISGLEFTETPARPTMNAILEEKANQAFDILVRDDLPAFITHIFIQTASVSIAKRVTGNLPPMLREASEGLAEVFCLTDPSRADNPIIFASEGECDAFAGCAIANKAQSFTAQHNTEFRMPLGAIVVSCKARRRTATVWLASRRCALQARSTARSS
jgi:hypothetical protein